MNKKLFNKLEKIVKKDFEWTLIEEKLDSKDFKEISKWTLIDMLEKAYQLGFSDAEKTYGEEHD